MDIDKEIKLAEQMAFRLLSRKGYFSEEIRQKLILKGVPERAIGAVLQKCERLGLLNDAEEKRRSIERAHKKGYGPRRIAHQLKMRGMTAEIQIDQVAAIRALLDTRYHRFCLSHLRDKQKVYLALQRRGFDFESINQAFLLKSMGK